MSPAPPDSRSTYSGRPSLLANREVIPSRTALLGGCDDNLGNKSPTMHSRLIADVPIPAKQGAQADGVTSAHQLGRHTPQPRPKSGDGPFKRPVSIGEAGQAEAAITIENPPKIMQDFSRIARFKQVEYVCGEQPVGGGIVCG